MPQGSWVLLFWFLAALCFLLAALGVGTITIGSLNISVTNLGLLFLTAALYGG